MKDADFTNNPSLKESHRVDFHSARTDCDLAAALRRMAGEVELLADHVRCTLEDAGPLVDRIDAAVRAGDGAAIVLYAHRFRGLVSMYDASVAVRIANDLERLGEARTSTAEDSAAEDPVAEKPGRIESSDGERRGDPSAAAENSAWNEQCEARVDELRRVTTALLGHLRDWQTSEFGR